MLIRVLSAALTALVPIEANAVCIHDGKDNPRTTLSEEFAESRWVVRARVTSAKDHWADEGYSWTVYRLHLLESFKGSPPQNIIFYTRRDSGGFFMDIPWKGHDIGGEYLLFLRPFPARIIDPPIAQRATFVNYECGQSRPWHKVSKVNRRQLLSLSAQHPKASK